MVTSRPWVRQISKRLHSTSVFLSHWQRSGCPLRELRNMERQTAEKPGQDWTELLAAYSGYVNVLYGEKFKEISLADTPPALSGPGVSPRNAGNC